MSCVHCLTARTRTHGGYDMNCNGCRARSVARSLVAWRALACGTAEARVELRHVVSRVLPQVPYDEARQTVLEWWANDHQEVTA